MTAVILRRSGSAIAISWRLKYRRSLVQCGVNLLTLGPHPKSLSQPWATVYTHLGPHPLSPPRPILGEGEARQGFPAPLLPLWEKGLGDEGKALTTRVSGLMCTPSPALGEGLSIGIET